MSRIIKPSDEKLFQSARDFEKRPLIPEPKPKRKVRIQARPSPMPKDDPAPEPESPNVPPTESAEEVRVEAERLLREARAKARRAKRKGKFEAEEIRAKARDQGYAEGFEEGRKQARQENAEQQEAHTRMLSSCITQMEAHASELAQSLKMVLADLAVELARKIIHRELESDSALVVSQAEQAISKILEREKLIIRVNPSDEAVMKEHKAVLKTMFDGTEKIEVIGDSDIERGGCVVETNLIKVDARASSQLEAAHRALLGETEQ